MRGVGPEPIRRRFSSAKDQDSLHARPAIQLVRDDRSPRAQRSDCSGDSICRMEASHLTKPSFHTVRRVSADLGIPVGVMVDIPGPKYRTGPQTPGEMYLESGDAIVLTSRNIIGSRQMLGVYPSGIHGDAKVGGRVLLR